MSVKLDYEFLFIGRDENSFLENYVCDFKHEFGEDSGQIFANIEIKNNPENAEEIGIMIYETMQKSFFADMDKEPYERFENTLRELNAALANMQYFGELHVIVAAVSGNTLYLSQTGEAEAYLVRKRYVTTISEGLFDENSEDVFKNIASGSIEPNDFVFFVNTRILRYISRNDFAALVRRGSISETLAEIRDAVSTEMLGRLGITGICFYEEVAVVEDESFEREDRPEELEDSGDDLAEESLSDEAPQERKVRKRSLMEKLKKGLFSGKNLVLGGGKMKKSFFSGSGARFKILITLVLIIFILIVSIFIANGIGDKNARLESLDKMLESVANKIIEAETKGTYDKEAASVLLKKAYEEALEVHGSGFYRDKAGIYLVRIEEARDKLDNVVRISEPVIYSDLSNVSSGLNLLGFVTLNNRVFVYDETSIVELLLEESLEPIEIASDEVIVSATGFENRSSIVFLTKSGKLLEYREGALSFSDTEDGEFKSAVSIDDWSSNIYLLDSESGQIWRYPYKASRERFGEAENYLASEDERLKESRDLTIDSSIYVLTGDSRILRFYAGEDKTMSIANEPFTKFTSAEKIYTRENSDYVYVLDSVQKRIFVFSKDLSTGRLNYRKQFLLDIEDDLRDIYEENGALYVLGVRKIYEIKI